MTRREAAVDGVKQAYLFLDARDVSLRVFENLAEHLRKQRELE
jgi:hypothetical protein